MIWGPSDDCLFFSYDKSGQSIHGQTWGWSRVLIIYRIDVLWSDGHNYLAKDTYEPKSLEIIYVTINDIR